MANQLDLASLFQSVTQNLMTKKDVLNQADTYNQNHGDNMVEIFRVITQAMEQKQDAAPSEQLAYASQLLKQKESGSAQVYAQNLFQASKEFQGQQITTDNAFGLLQSLLGAGQEPTSQKTAEPGDLLGSLLSGIVGGGEGSEGGGLDAADLLSAGMTFLQSKQEGDSDIEALADAFISTSPLSQSAHRSQSGAVVANTILQVLGSLGGK
jgi:hypothetical protein